MSFQKIKKFICISTIISIFSVIIPTVSLAASTVVMNKRSEGYMEVSGLFFDEVKNKDPNGYTMRYSFSANARLSYFPEITEEGNYIVYYYSSDDASNRSHQQFDIKSDDGETTLYINLRSGVGYQYLGVYRFTPGADNYISLTRDRKGGAIRSGAIKLVKTTKPVKPAYSQLEAPKTPRYFPAGNGIFVRYKINSEDFTFETTDGSFGTVALHDAAGRAVQYTYTKDGKVRYRPNIKSAGEYHVLWFNTQNGASVTNTNQPTTVYHAEGSTKFIIDCQVQREWIYLGKYRFDEGTNGYLETVNPTEGKMLCGGGAYFVSVDDEEFDETIYATPDSPGAKTCADETSDGEYIIGTNSVGYSEYGLSDKFKNSGELLDCDDRYSRYISKEEGTEDFGMLYNAKIKESGKYEVFYYVIRDLSNPWSQKVIINHKKGETECNVNCIINDGWVSLGVYEFASNERATVNTPSMGANGTLRSGGVKFVKQ